MSEISTVAAGDYHSPEALQAAVNRISAECHRNAEALRFIAPVLQAALENLDKVQPEKKWLAKGPARRIGDHLRRSAAAQEAAASQVRAGFDRFRAKILDPAIAAANRPSARPSAKDPNVFKGMPQTGTSHRRSA